MTRLPDTGSLLNDYIRDTFLTPRVQTGCKLCKGDEAGYRNSEMCQRCYVDTYGQTDDRDTGDEA